MFCAERPASSDIEMEHTTTEHFWLALEAFLCAYLTDTDAVRVVADFKQQYGNRLKVCVWRAWEGSESVRDESQ